MTCGIYLLKFDNTDKVYIGQSSNIEIRLNAHNSLAKRGIHSKKLQKAFDLHGTPTLNILIECLEENLDVEENILIKEFNAVEDGFNSCKIAGGGHSLQGEDLRGVSKFTNTQIIEAFLLLVYKQELTSSDISSITGVTKVTIDSLSSKRRAWLYAQYPEEYDILQSRSTITKFGKGKTLKDINKNYPQIISPNGAIFSIENCSQFSKEHNLNNAHVIQVLKGKEIQHKGWKAYNGR
jgi:hypothetical protein